MIPAAHGESETEALASGQGLDPKEGGDQHRDQGRGRKRKRTACGCRVDQGGVEKDGEEAKEEQGEADDSRPVASSRPLLSLDEGEWEKQHRAARKAQEPNGDRVSRSREKARGHNGSPAQGGRENGCENARHVDPTPSGLVAATCARANRLR